MVPYCASTGLPFRYRISLRKLNQSAFNMIRIIFGVVVVVVLKLLSLWYIQNRKYKDINKLPGPSSFSLVKSAFKKTDTLGVYNFMINLNKTYGSVVKLWMKPFPPKLIVADAKYVQQILATNNHLEKSNTYHYMKPLVGEGIATVKAEQWKQHRKILNPTFSLKNLENCMYAIDAHLQVLVGIVKSSGGKPTELSDVINMYTVDVTLELLSGVKTTYQTDNEIEYIQAHRKFFSIYLERVYTVWKQNDFLFKFTKSFQNQEVYTKLSRSIADGIINKRRQMRDNKINIVEDEDRNTLLDRLLENNMDPKIIGDNLETFVIAAHDTSCNQLCFLLFEIAKYPNIQKKILEESISILGKDKNAMLQFGDAQQMQYLEAVIKEGMRYHTMVPYIERDTGVDVTIDGIRIPKGTTVTFDLGNLHHSEEYFPNPYKFDPDRFLPENIDNILPNTYIPFSTGNRGCIGRHVAMLNMKATLTKLIRNFELLPVTPEHKIKPIANMIMKSLNGIPIIFKEREL